MNNCQTQTNQGSLSEEIKLAILKKASVDKNITLKKKAEEYRKKLVELAVEQDDAVWETYTCCCSFQPHSKEGYVTECCSRVQSFQTS